MNTSQKKQPLLFIGLIVFLAVAVVGILYDFIAKAGGMVAIISVAAAFLILGIILVIDALMRRKAKNQDSEDTLDDGEDRQFIRHTGEKNEEEPFNWNAGEGVHPAFAGFRRQNEEINADVMGGFESVQADGFDDSFDDAFEDMAQSEPVEAAPAEDAFAPQEAYEFDSADDMNDESADEYAQPEFDEAEPAEDDPFKPVLRLDGRQPAAQMPEEAPEQPVADEPQPEEVPAEPEEVPAEPEEQSQPEPEPEPQPEPVKQPAPASRPAERRAAAYAAPAVTAAAVGGQTIESFYDEMSDEDILYRDCVEVWAADAKPAALRLIKYVEGIEDKQTAALIGREVEYVNAMIDRINCFTQLEYIDELLEYKEHNYSTLVKDCLKRFSPFFMEKRLGLLWKGLDINVLTDRRWFIFALTQVIFNAVEFTPNGGKIAISAKKYDDFIDLTVEDSGKGIAPEELPFIFMAGYMGDDAPNESGRRTGMGLFIAQSVMRKMGGDMLAESVQGKGTRITLRMPIIDPMA